jgi:hypothetical protein
MEQCTFRHFMRMPHCPANRITQPGASARTRTTYWAAHVREWLSISGVIIVSYEDLCLNFINIMETLVEQLDFPAFAQIRFSRPVTDNKTPAGGPVKQHRKPQRGLQHVRKLLTGKDLSAGTSKQKKNTAIGQWRHFFDEQDQQFFTEETGDVMRRLRYRN